MSPSATADIRIGTVLRETYELTALLGKGGMGSVFLARHLRLPGKQVAVKVLLHSEDLSSEQFARFRREAEIASQLGHPNIVEVLDFHSLEDGTPYLVMEHLRGESLAQRLRKGRMSMREAFSVARQMGSALQAAHKAGVVHRDLKPANVFLVPSESEGMVMERVKLLDFGISKLMGSQTLQTQEDVLMGTPRYMAPEQAMGRNKDVDSRSDIFAFGCIIYEMLCGDSPFSGGNIAEVVYRVVHEHPESLATRMPDLPGRAVAAVDKALAKSPKDRYPDVATFISELTGTPLQTLASLGPDPSPPRGAVRPHEPSLHADENATDATFVPARGGQAAAEATPQPQPQALSAEQSIEFGSTLAAFRAQEPQASVPGAMTGSRRPTDLEIPAASVPAAPSPSPQPAAPAVQSEPVPRSTAPAVPASPPAARSKTPLVVGVGLVVLLAALFVGRGMLTTPSVTPPAPTPPAPVNNPPVAVTAPPPTVPDVAPGSPTVTPPPPEQPTVTPPPPTVEPKPPPSTPKNKPGAIPEQVRQGLAEAEEALKAGNSGDAIRIAQRTFQVQRTDPAFVLIGRAYCQQHDLGNANAQLLNLSLQGQKELRAACKKIGFSLSK
jgi:serine/threonine protein kinase